MKDLERIDDYQESIHTATEALQARVWTALPGIVVSVDLIAQTLEVQPAVQGQVTADDGTATAVNLSMLLDVPICWPRAGGFAVTFPIKTGDEVLVVFASRCIDAWWQTGGVQPPAEFRMHDLSDGFAILAPTSQPKAALLAGVSATDMEMRNEAGTTKIAVKASGDLKAQTPLGSFEVTAAGAVASLGLHISAFGSPVAVDADPVDGAASFDAWAKLITAAAKTINPAITDLVMTGVAKINTAHK